MRGLRFLLVFFFLSLSSVFAYPADFKKQNIVRETLDKFELSSQNRLRSKKKKPTYPKSLTTDYFSRRKEEIRKTLGFLEGKIYLSLNWYRYHLGYKEFKERNVLCEEFGWIHGYYAKLGYRSDRDFGKLWGKPFLEVYLRMIEDMITYKGATWGGLPVDFETKAEIQRYGGKFGGYKDLTKDSCIYGYIDIGKRVWFRGENKIVYAGGIPVLAYKEKYTWLYFGGGLGVEYRGIEKTSLGLDFELLFTPFKKYRKMTVYSHQTLPEFKFTLGGTWGLELNIPMKYYLFKNLSLDFTPYYIFWSIDESNYIPFGGGYVYEPESKSKIYGISCGFTINF